MAVNEKASLSGDRLTGTVCGSGGVVGDVERKALCDACGFVVRVYKHEERCAVGHRTPRWIKDMAWCGDGVLGLTVREAIYAKLGRVDGDAYTDAVRNDVLARFARYDDPARVSSALAIEPHMSDHSRGTRVEAAAAMSSSYLMSLMNWLGYSMTVEVNIVDRFVGRVIRSAGDGVAFTPLITGYIYLRHFNKRHWCNVARDLGPHPTGGVVLGHQWYDEGVEDEYLCHVVDATGNDTFESYFLERVDSHNVAEGSGAAAVKGAELVTDVGGPGQVSIDSWDTRGLVEAPDLRALLSSDLAACFCRVHSKPLTAPGPACTTTIGCVQKPAGKAGVIANAFNGVRGMCHADEATRRADRRMLEHWLLPYDPGHLQGKARSEAFAVLCSSSSATDMAAFGNGYCYLNLMHKDTWWRVARLLGPNPKLVSLYRALIWCGKMNYKMHSLSRVGSKMYHVAVDGASKGVRANAGAAMRDDIWRTIVECGDAAIG